MTLQYRHVGTLESSKTLTDAGITRVKHVFRYDLSPLFARLDDATKPVPVFDAKSRRIRFTHAPRCYRLPVRITVRQAEGSRTSSAAPSSSTSAASSASSSTSAPTTRRRARRAGSSARRPRLQDHA